MSLSPRAIAVQGLGYSTRLVAVQGLWPDAGTGGSGVLRVRIPRRTVEATRLRLIDEDDTLLVIAGALTAGAGRLQ